MQKHTFTSKLSLQLPLMALGVLAVASSFALGIKTAGGLQTVSRMEASGTRLTDDINGDGRVDVRDAIAVLEVVQGYMQATPDMLSADPDKDGTLTIDDAIRILNDISTR